MKGVRGIDGVVAGGVGGDEEEGRWKQIPGSKDSRHQSVR